MHLIFFAVIIVAVFCAWRLWRRDAARAQKILRTGLTLVIIALAVALAIKGLFQLAFILLLLVLPPVRVFLNPERKKLYAERLQKIASTQMNRAEALRVLELDEDELTAENVQASYKRLMAIVHPDKGGTGYFATKLNTARDYLLKELANDAEKNS